VSEAPAEEHWREERARLWAELQRLRAVERERDYWRELATQLQSSVSWRVTTPLRTGKTLAVKVRRRLDAGS
jgi:hypothetical protein